MQKIKTKNRTDCFCFEMSLECFAVCKSSILFFLYNFAAGAKDREKKFGLSVSPLKCVKNALQFVTIEFFPLLFCGARKRSTKKSYRLFLL